MLFLCFEDSSRALFLRTYIRRFFISTQDSHHRMPFASISALAEILGWKLFTLLTVNSLFQLESSLVAHSKNNTVFYFVAAGFCFMGIWLWIYVGWLTTKDRQSWDLMWISHLAIFFALSTWLKADFYKKKRKLDTGPFNFLSGHSTAAHILESVAIDARSEATRSTSSWFSPLQFIWRQCHACI